ncbi:SGNH/GDSL hydrolase family protein [Viridibacterium curvum]|uniref:Ice-binding protein C-terminal domain-containing protein n=1 Tax=Viridibacterium curvum TaxID=1101404 RepID=A0ABP9QMI8_9RHOO
MNTSSPLRHLRNALVASSLLCTASISQATTYSNLVVFGDSLSDPGNALALTGGLFPPAPYSGTFSNGPTAVQYLATSLGVSAQNYAVGGAMTNTQNYLALDIPSLAPTLGNTGIASQIASWSPSASTASSLFVIWGGPNDFSYNFGLAAAGVSVDFNAVVAQTIGNIASGITTLAAQGAHDFLIPYLPDLGLTPRASANGAGFASFASMLSSAYNAGLDATLDSLETGLGLTIHRFDTAQYMQGIIADPASVGLSNVTTPCIAAGAATIAGGCAGYLYFDDIHPTTYAHALIGAEFAQAVPEPASVLMMLGGLGLMGLLARRRLN